MAYVEVIVVPMKKDAKAAYTKMVKGMAKVWKKLGAKSYHEMIADDVKPGKMTGFPNSLMLKDDEVVVVATITFVNKAARNRAWGKFMKEPAVMKMNPSGVMDMQRTFFGGFKTLHKV